MDAQPPRSRKIVSVDEIVKIPGKPLSHRALLKIGGAGVVATTLASNCKPNEHSGQSDCMIR